MSFQLTHKLPKECLVAVSGGIDSIVALHWLNQVRGRVRGVVHLHHNSHCSDLLYSKVVDAITQLDLPLHFRKLKRKPGKGDSEENWWREQRYRWFKEASAVNGNLPIVVAHQLDDCLEEYVMCTMVRGFSGTIPYAHGPCIRPFRLWKRLEIMQYAFERKLVWYNDAANFQERYKRVFIRKHLTARLLSLNPGIHKIVERIVREQDVRDGATE